MLLSVSLVRDDRRSLWKVDPWCWMMLKSSCSVVEVGGSKPSL